MPDALRSTPRRPAQVVAFPDVRAAAATTDATELADTTQALHDALECLLIAEDVAPGPGPARDLALARARAAFDAARARHPFLEEDAG